MVFYNKKNGTVYVNGVGSPSLTMIAFMAGPKKSILWLSRKQCERELNKAAGIKWGNGFIKGFQQAETMMLINNLDGYTR